MRRPFVFALAVCITLPLLAAKKPPTAPGKYEAWGPDIDELEIVRTFKASDYKRVVVEPLDVSKTPPPEDADMAEKVSKVLAEATKPFLEGLAEEETGLEIASEQKEEKKGTLLVRGRVTTMDPGSRSKRLLIGYGAGAARAAIEGELVDAATGEVLLRFTQERRSGVERFGRGSSYEEIMARNLVKLGEDVANILKQF
ncbi:MAG TPA: DUF4410 domain-containing protein [Thermoanaerobaculia bacterium]